MSKTPKLPSPDGVLADLLRRVEILEAVSPSNLLDITDGTTTFPTSLFTIPPSSGRLSDLGSQDTLFHVGQYLGYVPTLQTSGTPASGTFSLTGNYTQDSELIVCWGKLEMGAGFNRGTGTWSVTVPQPILEWSVVSNRFVGAGFIVGGGNMLPLWAVGVSPAVDQIEFAYPATWPAGAAKELATGGDWTFASGDILHWFAVYPTAFI